MKYYVNVFFPGDELPELPCNYNYIGLFTEKQYKGVGYFCGGYNSEYYLNARLAAFYVTEGSGENLFNNKIIEAVKTDIFFKKLLIQTGLIELTIEAESLKEAYQKFSNMKF